MKVKDFITGLFILLAVGAMLTSCKKDEGCGCGETVSKGMKDGFFPFAVVKDECSGERIEIDVHPSKKNTIFIGKRMCK